jgi:chromosome segregation ATPase
MKDRANNALKEQALCQEEFNNEMQDLEKELKRYDQTPEELEADYRRSFAQEVEDEIQNKQKVYRDEIDEGLRNLEKNYREESMKNQGRLSRKKHANESLEAELESKRAEVQGLRTDAATLSEQVRSETARVARLNAQIHKANDTYNTQSKVMKKNLVAARSEKYALDTKYDDLMDMRVAMDVEIRRYHSLLDNEEDRLNYVSPQKGSF